MPQQTLDDSIIANQDRIYQERLKSLRARHGLSERELRRRANDPKTIREAEKARRQMDRKE